MFTSIENTMMVKYIQKTVIITEISIWSACGHPFRYYSTEIQKGSYGKMYLPFSSSLY